MNTYAIIEAGGEQLQVEPGRFYDIRHLVAENMLPWKPNISFLLYRVLMIHHHSTVILGTPWVKNATIKGRVLHTRRNEKVLIYKMNSKKKTRRKNGYRQGLVRFAVDAICLNEFLFKKHE